MKRIALCLVLVGLLPTAARADLILGSSNPTGNPLDVAAGATSGPFFVNVSSSTGSDVMAAWQFNLVIVAEAGATGTLAFQNPATGTPANPTNYVFGSNGLGIVATNGGGTLSANDFFDPSVGPGATVPGGLGANLLQMDFLASAGASGLFGIYALQGPGNTLWVDGNLTEQFFSNVPDGTGMVLLGDVQVQAANAATPEPSALALLGLGCATLVGGSLFRRMAPFHRPAI
jgi:hypothetical protein